MSDLDTDAALLHHVPSGHSTSSMPPLICISRLDPTATSIKSGSRLSLHASGFPERSRFRAPHCAYQSPPLPHHQQTPLSVYHQRLTPSLRTIRRAPTNRRPQTRSSQPSARPRDTPSPA
ncbi:hypothetical protein L207DRAFT_511182 [Hyaloscypha variabilis F]|uniref:Uncharacterized protein n=1 Tax=Hyaloscypha variabilis (strain UAMH 11265 / GT02V1 / F) TaxID=1149755 RepID=A0A2J6RRY5_HYAVF|nr:hypothetical protein L207DRAFT_511182 [Hyaloscypha variabilis F]